MMTSSRTLSVLLVILHAATARADREVLWSERPPEVNVASWVKTHGVRRFHEKECFESPVGVPAKEGLICRRAIGRDEGDWNKPQMTFALVYQLREHGLRLVWRGQVAAWMNWVDLVPTISVDGTTLVLSERYPGESQQAYCDASEQFNLDIVDEGFMRRLLRACSSRGRWVWKDGAYRRDASDQPPRVDRGVCNGQ